MEHTGVGPWAEPHYIFASGFADLPKGTTAYELFRVIAFVMVVDSRDDTVVDANFSFGLQLTQDFMRSLVIGRKALTLERDMHELVRTRFLSPIPGAILQAVRNACDRYREWKRVSAKP